MIRPNPEALIPGEIASFIPAQKKAGQFAPLAALIMAKTNVYLLQKLRATHRTDH
jgi:hypothetical protein